MKGRNVFVPDGHGIFIYPLEVESDDDADS
jgi:hypothetical protein